MYTPMGRGHVGIDALMTPIFKTSIPASRNNITTLTLNAGKPGDFAFGRRASIGAVQPFKKNAEGRDGLSVFKGKKQKVTNNLMTPFFGCGVPVRAAQVNKGMVDKPPISLQGGQGSKRSFTSTVNPSSSLQTTANWFTTPMTQKMDIDLAIGERTFPRDERSAGLTRNLPGLGKVGTHAGEMNQKSFQKPTPRRNIRFQMPQDKKLVVSCKQDAKFPATPKNCRMVVCPPVGAPQYKQLFINIENNEPFPRSDGSMTLREINC